MDLFTLLQKAEFSPISLMAAIDKVTPVRARLGQLGIYTDSPQRNKIVKVESRNNVLSLIQTSQRGEAIESRQKDGKVTTRFFETPRIAKKDRIQASELAFIKGFGAETQMKMLQQEIASRQVKLVNDMELTKENHRLGGIQGVVLDADGATLYDWKSEFEVALPDEIAFDLANAVDGELRENIDTNVVLAMQLLAKGMRYSGIRALCGHQFYADLIKNPEVRATYLQQQEASELRNGYGNEFSFGGVTWERYIGTDDASKVRITSTECKFIPENSDAFEVALSPAESFGDLGTSGRPVYAYLLPDPSGHDEWVDLEIRSYPMYMAKRPEVLFSGKTGA